MDVFVNSYVGLQSQKAMYLWLTIRMCILRDQTYSEMHMINKLNETISVCDQLKLFALQSIAFVT